MSKVSAFHTSQPGTPAVYHNDSECPYGNLIEPENKLYGADDRPLCRWCAEHTAHLAPADAAGQDGGSE
jgi:hypothetical protein